MGRKPSTAGIKVDPEEIDYESMVFYITWYDQLLELEKTMGAAIFNRGVKELCEYSFHGTIPDNSDNPVLKMFFNMARASIDANIKYKIIGKKASDARWNKSKDTEEEKPEPKKCVRKKKEEPKPALTPKEKAEAEGYEDVDEDGFYPATPHNVAIDLAKLEKQ